MPLPRYSSEPQAGNEWPLFFPLSQTDPDYFQEQLVRPSSESVPAREADGQRQKIIDAVADLGINLPAYIMAELVGRYDSMAPLQRFLAEPPGRLAEVFGGASDGLPVGA